MLQPHYITGALRQQRATEAVIELEDGDLDVQESLGVLAEIADQEAHVAGEGDEVGVEMRSGKEFAGSGGIVVELGGGSGEIAAGVVQFVVESFVGDQF